MLTSVFQFASSSEMLHLLEFARKPGLKPKVLSKTEQKGFGSSIAIQEGQTNQHVNTEEFLRQLEGGNKD